MAATREFISRVDPDEIGESVGNVRVTDDHFEQAMEEVTPSVDAETRERYEEIEQRFDKRDAEVEDDRVERTFH